MRMTTRILLFFCLLNCGIVDTCLLFCKAVGMCCNHKNNLIKGRGSISYCSAYHSNKIKFEQKSMRE